MKFSDAVEGYWLACKRDRSHETFLAYSRIQKSFQDWIGDKEVEEITRQDVNGYLNYLSEERGVQAQTVMNHWIALSSFWKWASKELDVPHVIAEGVARPKVQKKPRTPYTQDEVKLILRGIRYMRSWDPANERHKEVERPTYVRDMAVVAVLLDTGLRASELCDLKIRDFNRQNGKLIIMHGKGDKQRVLPLGDRSRRRLWQYLTKREEYKPADPLFVTKKGDAFDRDYLYRLVKRAGARYDVPKVGTHRFRHTFAINFLRNGGSPLELQRMLGHEKLETVLVYVRLADVDIESAQKRASVGDAWKI